MNAPLPRQPWQGAQVVAKAALAVKNKILICQVHPLGYFITKLMHLCHILETDSHQCSIVRCDILIDNLFLLSMRFIISTE